MAEESAVKVCVRVRPLIAREESASTEDAEPVKHFWKANKKSIQQVDDENPTKSFNFDRVFTADESTNQLYQAIARPLVVSAVEGYNGTIFAYGQTSSGKTFTMMGDGGSVAGVIPLAVEDVFQSITNLPTKEFLLRVSYMEIYNETVVDLLVSSWKRKPLEVRETINKNVFVADLTEEVVTSSAQVLAWIRKGEKNRRYGETKMNQRSSRSHTIFRMIIESRDRSDPASGENADGGIIVSHLNLVDLAGSERASQTGAEGTRFKEGCNINRSLFTLGQVIKKLTDEKQKPFTSYRDSKLTRILQNSLGGNAKTVIICTITPVTLEETLSTLQFASTAKKMKNDPHVTEVSDDGALLKRYRNEIVDLKRRLQEVSSVTQTTATEKEVLSQLLQEKEMLQREQEDRIRNLTTLLVTSTTQGAVRKVPKRRVTWGGKMMLTGPGVGEAHPCDLHLSQSFMPKRKAYGSSLTELCEDDEDFYSHWEIPEEPQDEMESSQGSVTVRSFRDSPTDGSSDWVRELSSKVSNLEQQLDVERLQKEKAWEEVEILKSGTAERQLRLAELELQLQSEVGLKREAVEKVEMLELRAVDVEQQNHTLSETAAQMKRQFAETAQLCEALAKDKEEVLMERDYLKQEVEMFIEQTKMLEEEKSALSQEVWDLRDLEEFKTLENDFNREHQNNLQIEIANLKTALEASDARCQRLQSELEGLSEQLKTKTEFAAMLQSMEGNDLVQEVVKLRRSLDDAEGVSRDTKKEWAFLRSENMALEETNATLTENHHKMKTELKGLLQELETEKSRYKNMQSDLQKELKMAFEENDMLNGLLAGKVPKNLVDSFEAEKTVTRLNTELAASREAQEVLRAQLEEFPATVDALSKQVQHLKEELLSAEARWQKDTALHRDAQQASRDEAVKLKQELSSAALREVELRQRHEEMVRAADSLGSDLQRGEAERSRLEASLEEKVQQLEESEHLKASREGKLEEMQELLRDLEERLANSQVSRSTEEDASGELRGQVKELKEKLEEKTAAYGRAVETNNLLSAKVEQLGVQLQEHQHKAAGTHTLTENHQPEPQEQKPLGSDLNEHSDQESDLQENKLQCMREKEASPQSCEAELAELRSTLASVSAERDQLKLDLQENVDIMIEVQEELRTAIQNNQKQKEHIKQLKTTQTSKPKEDPSQTEARLEELHAQIKILNEDLQATKEERAILLSEESGRQKSAEETEELRHRVTSLSDEREELQELLAALRQEKQQLAAQLEETTQSLHTEMKSLSEELQQMKAEKSQLEEATQSLNTQMRHLTEKLQTVEAERAILLSEESGRQKSAEETEELRHRVTSLSDEREELQELLAALRQEKQQLAAQLEETTQSLHTEMKSLSEELQQMKAEKSQLEEATQSLNTQMRHLTEKLQTVEAERAILLSEESGRQKSAEETEELRHRVTSLSDEREELQELLAALRQEKQQLAAQLEETTQSLHTEMKSLSEELQQMKAEKSQLEEATQSLNTQMRHLTEKLQTVEAERAILLSEESGRQKSAEETEELRHRVTSLSDEREELQELLAALRQEKQQLAAQLEETTQSLHTEMKSLSEELQQMKAEKSQLEEATQSLNTQASDFTEKLQSLEAERAALLSEKESIRQSLSEETRELQHTLTALLERRSEQEKMLETLTLDKHLLQARLSLIESELGEQEDTPHQVASPSAASVLSPPQLDPVVPPVPGTSGLRRGQQLQDQRQRHREQQADVTQQVLGEAVATIPQRERLRNAAPAREVALQDSTKQLQEALRKLQRCTTALSARMENGLRDIGSLSRTFKTSPPKLTTDTYEAVREVGQIAIQRLIGYVEQQSAPVQGYMRLLQELARKDVALFEEKRLQDLLLCRAQAPDYSVQLDDLHPVWERRLGRLLERRQSYLQKLSGPLETLSSNVYSFLNQVHGMIGDLVGLQAELDPLLEKQPVDFSLVDAVLRRQLEHRHTIVAGLNLQGIPETCRLVFEELEQLEVEVDADLREERSRNRTVLQALEGVPLKTELSLLEDNQHLQDTLKAVCLENQLLKETLDKTSSRDSDHEQNNHTQLEEKEKDLQALQSKLEESQTRVSLSAAELDKVKAKVFQMEAALTSANDQHQKESQRLSTMLKEKDDVVRKLKETLRRQQGEESFLTGADLYARLTQPKRLTRSGEQQERSRLEEEVKQLQHTVSELESVSSSQQAELSKWKSRALKLKSKAEAERPPSPRTPRRTGFPLQDSPNFLKSPKKVPESPLTLLDSPKKLHSPKSSFFDVDNADVLRRVAPRRFFDNSILGTVPDAVETEEWRLLSPSKQEKCQVQ